MHTRDLRLDKFALYYGALFVIVGILGFIQGLVQAPPMNAPGLAVETGYGWLLGLFAVNVMHNLVHLAIGVWGIISAKDNRKALTFARGVTIFYGVLTVLGLIPATSTLFGLAPIFGHDVWLHALSALVAGYFGYGPPAHVYHPTLQH
jgi:hypothetical protein